MQTMTASPLPSLFVPHGAPTFALRPGAAGAALARQADTMPRPRAIVAVSAHWATTRPTVGTAARLETLHDFRGFPEALYGIRYPASGCPEAAQSVADAIASAGMDVEFDAARGLDHGAWVPLRMMFPDADVPIVPLSLQPGLGPAHALRVGRALAPLRREGLLVVASGNLTHNLRDYFNAPVPLDAPPAYVRAFAEWIHRHLVAQDTDALLEYRARAPGALRAHPSEEHLLPLFVALGAAGRPFETLRFHAGIDEAVLAMDAFAFTTPGAAPH